MLGPLLLSLVAAELGVLQGLVEAASPPVVNGTCGSSGCYVELEGPQRTRFLQLDQQIVDSSDPCFVYQCTALGVVKRRLHCPPILTCRDGSRPVGFPDTCCPRCLGYRRHEVCGFSQWSEWGQCSVSCGGGKQACVRHPVDLSRIQALSLFCNGSLTEIKDCNQYPCPVDCKWEWGQYGECSASCGRGRATRYPMVTQRAHNGGEPCPPPDVIECSLQPCQNEEAETLQDRISAIARIMAKLLENTNE